MRIWIAAVGLVVAGVLGGCAVGIQPGGEYPSDTFVVPISYQEAFRRADAQPRECLPHMTTTGNLFTDNKTGVVRVAMPSYSGSDLIRVNLREMADGRTEVTAMASDNGMFDMGQVIAMRESLETGKPVCRSPKYSKFE